MDSRQYRHDAQADGEREAMSAHFRTIALLPVITLFAIAASQKGFSVTPEETTPQGASYDANIPLAAGDYLFLGTRAGPESKVNAEDLGTTPMNYLQLDPATKRPWDLRFVVYPPKGIVDGKWTWRIEEVFRTTDPTGAMYDHITMRYDVSAPGGAKVENLEIRRISVQRNDGLDMDVIPYALVDGEMRYFVVAKGKSFEPFAKAITIPKSFILWRWSNPSALK